MRVLRPLVVVLLLASLLCVVGFVALCLNIDYHGRHDLAQPADVIVVLGAQVLPDGQPGPDLRSRTEHAVSLYSAGLAPRLICAGGVQGDAASAAAVCKTLAVELGTPAESIFLADGSSNTEEDARQVAAVMFQHGWHTAVLVSHPLHLYRAKLFCEREGLTVYTSPTTTDLDRIDLPLRGYYTVRECVAVLWPYLEQAGFPPAWTAALEDWVYSGP
jgi:uncharacterized SAM-binding protein YcdF (DUF218 family)